MRLVLLVLHIIVLLVGKTVCFFNLYVGRNEVQRTLGLNAELRYVNNGTINNYALGFVVMVPDNIWDLHFTWQSLRNTPVPYSISISVTNPEAMSLPQLNISRKGNIPTTEEVFQMVFQCTGKVSAEVDMYLNMNFSLPPSAVNASHLELKRKKICYKSNSTDDALLIDAMVATGSSFYIAVSCACAILVIVSIISTYLYVKSMKTRRADVMQYGGSSPALSASTQGHTFLRPDTPNNNSSVNSYASFKRLTPITTTTTSVQVKEVPKPKDLSEQIAEIRIERRRILFQEKVQEGTFGQIYHAVIRDDNLFSSRGLDVFVKTVTDQASSIQISLLTAEGMMMLGMNSKYILPLIGYCTDDPYHPLLIYPHMSQGNLKKFLHKCMLATEGHCYALRTQDLVGMALQILEGIAFLHRNRVIHRDIAARNCVVDDWLQVKLTDNALARDLFPHDYDCLGDNENRPIKWLAIESLLKKEFSFASDVWAFGVTMWELITLGQQPYIEIDPSEMHLCLRDGYRLDQPKNCPDDLFEVMSCTWATISEERPSVSYLKSCLQVLDAKLGRFI